METWNYLHYILLLEFGSGMCHYYIIVISYFLFQRSELQHVNRFNPRFISGFGKSKLLVSVYFHLPARRFNRKDVNVYINLISRMLVAFSQLIFFWYNETYIHDGCRFLTNNSLSGPIPDWILSIKKQM